jgi:isoleucyl-tRNA synthetase
MRAYGCSACTHLLGNMLISHENCCTYAYKLDALKQQAQRWEMSSSSSTTDAATTSSTTSTNSSNSTNSSKFTPSPEVAAASTNVMDIWVQASLQGLIQFVHEEMSAYRLYTVVPKLVDFIQDLTNWYVCITVLTLQLAL